MTDQNTLAEKVQKIAAEMRDAMRREDDGYPYAEFLSDMGDYIRDLEALLPPLPTLADMTLEDRAACLRMQCDTGPNRSVRGFIAAIHTGGCYVVERETWEWRSCSDDLVTPRPDLPRMEWPGTEKPAPAPALPDGWRLADHKDHGRVVVTNPTPNRDGRVHFVIPSADPMGFDWLFCDHSELTYTDQEDDQ